MADSICWCRRQVLQEVAAGRHRLPRAHPWAGSLTRCPPGSPPAFMDFMRLCRFAPDGISDVHVGLITTSDTLVDLTGAGVHRMQDLLERADLTDELMRRERAGLEERGLDRVRLLTPVESQEVWAVGVTYLRSKQARMEESEFSADVYDRVYEAARPELFFKSLPDNVVSPG